MALAWSEQLERGESLDPYYVVALRRWSREPQEFATARIVPRLVPGEAWQVLGVSAVLVLFALVRRPEPEPSSPARPPAPSATSALLPPAELEAVRAEVDEASARMQSAEGKELAEELERLARGLGEAGLSAEDAFRRIAELEAEVAARAADRQAWLDGLAARGTELEKSGLSRQVGRELAARRPEDAAESLRKLAERLESKTEKLTEKELAELRSALESSRPPEHVLTEREREAQAEQQRAEATRDRLLQKKQQEGGLNEQEQKDLERAERELKRLERRKSGGAESELSELDKELLEAAKQLRDEQRKSAGESLERAEKKFSQGAQRSLSDADKKEMLERLRQMKESLRRQREEGSDARERFEKRARGQQGQDAGEGEPGAGQPGDGQPGEGQGAGSMPIPIPGASRPGAPAGAGEGQPQPTPGAESEPGTSHDPNVAGDRTESGVKPGDATMAVAQDSGEGATATETIRTAAEAGFTRPSYEKLYRSYETVAEEVIEREKIPPGYRSHVERYFQLIRPRTSERKKP